MKGIIQGSNLASFYCYKFSWYILFMKINSINSTIFTPKTTGYAAAAGLGLSVWSGLSKNKSFNRVHKPLAFFTAFFTIMHVGLIEYYNYKFKHKQVI